MPGSHPVPDERSVAAANEALRRLAALKEGQEALVLVSGGGSALLAAPHGVTLAQKQRLTKELLRAGADISDINTVRRHLSRTKGGRLAQATRARVRALLLSDVVGDDMSVIASGPTVPDATTFADALAVLERYGLAAPEARAHFASGTPDTPDALPNVINTVVGSNRLLLEAAQKHLAKRGVASLILGDTFGGEARELARFHASLVRSVQGYGSPARAPAVLPRGPARSAAAPRGWSDRPRAAPRRSQRPAAHRRAGNSAAHRPASPATRQETGSPNSAGRGGRPRPAAPPRRCCERPGETWSCPAPRAARGVAGAQTEAAHHQRRINQSKHQLSWSARRPSPRPASGCPPPPAPSSGARGGTTAPGAG